VKTTSGDVTASPSHGIEAFSVSQCFNSVTVYFDDVKIFSVFDLDPKLELVPAEGIAATTLVGSGFAPNSKISVTWDDIPIPTVPSPLITDGYGNFTAIISVLNQTTSGVYTVKAVDEIETEANASFTVYAVSLSPPSYPIEELYEQQEQYEELPEFPEWIILPLLLITTLATIGVRKRISSSAS
jgi:hypothetical protein